MAVASTSLGSSTANHLINERSLYLLQHAHNPVDWNPWSEEALTKAVNENKLIFLSVGYSSCHWCHVMERESFEDPEVAAVMNRYYVSVKVDREERPDIDQMYTRLLQATLGSAGWPMSIWLTPELQPILAETYLPPSPKYGKPSFISLLKAIAISYEKNPSEIRQCAQQTFIFLRHICQQDASPIDRGLPAEESIKKCFDVLSRLFDDVWGGFGPEPKFPTPVNLKFLFHYARFTSCPEENSAATNMLKFTLQKMANGGVHDHIFGGFHRYSVDRKWHVPHFEKMLYDQGQLAEVYALFYSVSHEQRFATTAADILSYVDRNLCAASGAFYSAEDAESRAAADDAETQEGIFYSWKYDDVVRLLAGNINGFPVLLADVFVHHYNIMKNGNIPSTLDQHGLLEGRNVLMCTSDIETTAKAFGLAVADAVEAVEKGRQILRHQRERAPKPDVDRKIVTAWNGLMISGYSAAARFLKQPAYLQTAVQAAEFLLRHCWSEDSHELRRICYLDKTGNFDAARSVEGFAEDYAMIISAFLSLYESSFDDRWIRHAKELQDRMDTLFRDDESGSYFVNRAPDERGLLRIQDETDGATPCVNSLTALNLARLHNILGDEALRSALEKLLTRFSSTISSTPFAVPLMVCAFMLYSKPTKKVIICGVRNHPVTEEMLSLVNRSSDPFRTILLLSETDGLWLKNVVEELRSFSASENTVAYVCSNFSCSSPIYTADELSKLL